VVFDFVGVRKKIKAAAAPLILFNRKPRESLRPLIFINVFFKSQEN